jgi:hypothetical protein
MSRRSFSRCLDGQRKVVVRRRSWLPRRLDTDRLKRGSIQDSKPSRFTTYPLLCMHGIFGPSPSYIRSRCLLARWYSWPCANSGSIEVHTAVDCIIERCIHFGLVCRICRTAILMGLLAGQTQSGGDRPHFVGCYVWLRSHRGRRGRRSHGGCRGRRSLRALGGLGGLGGRRSRRGGHVARQVGWRKG